MMGKIEALRGRLDDIRDDRHFPAHMLSALDEMEDVLSEMVALTPRAPADLRSALEAETIERSDTDEEIISAFNLTLHYGTREIEALFRSIRALAPTKGDAS